MILVNNFWVFWIITILILASVGEVVAIVSLGPVLNSIAGTGTDNLFGKIIAILLKLRIMKTSLFILYLFLRTLSISYYRL